MHNLEREFRQSSYFRLFVNELTKSLGSPPSDEQLRISIDHELRLMNRPGLYDSQEVYTYNDFMEFNPRTGTILMKQTNTYVDLSPLQSLVFTPLIRRPEKAIGKQAFYDALKIPNNRKSYSILRQAISHTRDKIGPGYIHTIRHVGYVLQYRGE
jgi:DNA-binding response OmpR family regulator